MDLRETYNRIAEDWHQDHLEDDWWIEGTEKFVSRLSRGSRILDVGCGSGVKSSFFIKRGMRVVGIDFSSKLIEIAKKEVPEGEFHVLPMEKAASLHQTFDALFAQASLLHIPHQEIPLVLEELRRTLKPGGLFYLAVKAHKENQKKEDILQENDYGYAYSRFFSYFTLEEMTDFLENAGFKIMDTSITPFGKTHWIQIIAKKLPSKG